MKSFSAPSFSPAQAGPFWTHQQIDIAPQPPLGVRFYGRRSNRAGGVSPLVIHFHAGAFVAGSLETGSCIPSLLAYAGRLRGAGRVVQGAVLPGPTGWPGTYLQPASHEAAWAPAVQQQFNNFFRDLSGSGASGDAAHGLFSSFSTPISGS